MPEPCNRCPRTEDLPALVQGELGPKEAALTASHAEACPICRKALADYRIVLAAISRDRIPSPCQGLRSAVMASVGSVHAGPSRGTAAAAAAAAVLVIVLAAAAWNQAPTPAEPSAVRDDEAPRFSREQETLGRALDWLSQAQDPEGSFNPVRFGGEEVFAVGLTGLALLAFLGAEENPFLGPHSDTIVRGLRFLRKTSRDDGCLSSPGQHLVYNQALGAMALCEAAGHPMSRVSPEEALKPLRYLGSLQRDTGGFGSDSLTSLPNSCASTWAILALRSGNCRELAEFDEAASRALRWMAGLVDSRGRLGYRDVGDFPFGSAGMTAAAVMHFFRGGRHSSGDSGRDMLIRWRFLEDVAGLEPASDYCSAFFAASALSSALGPANAQASRRIKEALASVQVKSGPEAGSWEPTDRWSGAGGRIYSTAMAALALETCPPPAAALQRG